MSATSIDRALEAGVRAALEAAVARITALDDEAPRQLTRLEGRRIDLALVDGPRWRFTVQEGRVRLLGGDEESVPADARLEADWEAVRRVIFHGEAVPRGVRIEGEVGVVEDLRAFLRKLDPNWERELAGWVGPTHAARVAAVIRALVARLGQWAATARRDAEEWLTEEARWLPPRAEGEELFRAIDELRGDTDRLEARLRLLAGGADRGHR